MNQLMLTDDELRFLRRCVNLRNQSLQFQINEFTRDEVHSTKFRELYKEQSWCDEMVKKLRMEELK